MKIYEENKKEKKNINTEAYWDNKYTLSKDFHVADFREQFMVISKYIPKGCSLLDIGCGNGDTLKLLEVNDITKDLYGADISNRALELTKSKVSAKLIKLYFEPSELPVKDLDVITIIHLIEHLSNPEEYLRLWLKSIKKTGTAIIIIPLDDNYPEHTKMYTLDDVKNLVEPLSETYEIIVRNRMKGIKEAIAILRFNIGYPVLVKIDPYITSDKTFLPTDIYLEVSNLCNATCYMCPYKDLKRKRGFMNWELFKEIINNCTDIQGKGIEFYLHNFGEPLLDTLLVERIKYIKNKCQKSKVNFSTNAALLTKEKSEEIIKAGLDCMVISLDSLDPEIYSEMRGLKLEIVMKNVNDLLDLITKLKSNLSVTMQMVLCDKNKHEEEDFKKMWKDKKVRIVVKYMHNFLTQGTSYLTDKLSDKQLLPCMQPFMHLMIYWNGDLGLCCWDADHYINLGNIKDKSIIEIFNTEQYKNIRKSMLDGDCKHIFPCNKCSQIYGQDMNISIFKKRVRIKKDV